MVVFYSCFKKYINRENQKHLTTLLQSPGVLLCLKGKESHRNDNRAGEGQRWTLSIFDTGEMHGSQ